MTKRTTMMRWLAGWVVVVGAVARLAAAEPDGYVYSSFTGDGEDGLHLLVSSDARSWQPVKGYQSIYQQAHGLMRDPSICRGGDGKYHMVWTTGWWNDTIGLAHSDDLLKWSPMETLHIWADYAGPGSEESDGKRWPKDLTAPAERHPLVRNCWAPEIFFDDETREYVIFWATTIDDAKVFPQTWDAGRWERMNQRIYFITTKDFKTYTPRRFFFATAERVVIDACLAKVAPGTYRMVIKDELQQRLHTAAPAKPLKSWATMPANFWGPLEPAFTGPGIQPDDTNAEGPTCVHTPDGWLVFCDYWASQQNGLFLTKDFKSLTRITEQLKLPGWTRHGTVLKVPAETVKKLKTEN